MSSTTEGVQQDGGRQGRTDFEQVGEALEQAKQEDLALINGNKKKGEG